MFYEDKDMSQWYEKLKCHDVNEREKAQTGQQLKHSRNDKFSSR